MPEPKLSKAPCNRCYRETKHQLLNSRITSGSDEVPGYGSIWWQDTYDMLECCGCESVTLRHTNIFSDSPDEPRITYYPPVVSRPPPVWRKGLPRAVSDLAEEVDAAVHVDSRRLSLMGARALADMVLLKEVGDHGTFKDKLAAFERLGFVGRRDREVLQAALDAGSAAAHRGYNPKPEQLHQVLDIVDHMLKAVYVLNPAAKELRQTTPARGRRSGKTGETEP